MIYLACDHGGFGLKNQLLAKLTEEGVPVQDLCKRYDENDDYPDAAQILADYLLVDKAQEIASMGIAICRSGQGMCMALNRFKWVRAGFANSIEEVSMMRHDNNANCMCLAADFTSFEQASQMVDQFIKTPFSNEERHHRRVEKLDKLG
jgi:ribose 5-phosphate isomerase B